VRSLSVIKPGIIVGNIITLCGGYFLGSRHPFHYGSLFIAMLGMALVIASGCTLNNIIDRDIDSVMERTKKRVLVTGALSIQRAWVYTVAFAALGFLVLYFGTNGLTTLASLVGLVVYIGTYTLWSKRKSIHSTLIGGVAGAMPPVVGYCAATNQLDSGALIAFLVLLVWQIPHFYAIAIFRLGDFSKAELPVMPLKRGVKATKRSILSYIGLFTFVALLPTFLGYTGFPYLIIALLVCLAWFVIALKGFKAQEPEAERAWARKVFFFSIIVITVLSFAMAIK